MCGVVGIMGTPDAAREAFLGLTTLQHRGQDAAGILSYDGSGFHSVKNLGLVESVFTKQGVETLTGNLAVGHARYATIGRGDLIDVQPFVINFPFGLGLVHNGNIVNTEALKRELKTQGRRHLLTSSDSEIILNLLAEALASHNHLGDDGHFTELDFDSICKAVDQIFKRAVGSYSIVTLIADQGLLAFRDPNGIRPLVWGKRKEKRQANPTSDSSELGILPTGEAHCVASESVALSFLGYEVVRDLKPGEVLFIDKNGKEHTRVLQGREPRHCMFEWVYFASPESVMDGSPVYGARIGLGKSLAQLVQKGIDAGKMKPDLIVPVPETSRIAAIALSEELGIPYREVLIKNRYIKRTFILDSQEKRQKAVNLKLSPVRSEIEGKKVLLVDDSIVRGTTSRKIIELVRAAGAKEVYFVSTCPPISYPCYYGIDFPSGSELIAFKPASSSGANASTNQRSLEEIEKALGADCVVYQDLEGLRKSVGHKNPCMACLTGQYPTDVSQGAQFGAARTKDRQSSTSTKNSRGDS